MRGVSCGVALDDEAGAKTADEGIERENGVEADDEAGGADGLRYAGASGSNPG